MNEEKVLDISWGTIFKIGTAALGFYLFYMIRDILIWFIFAIIISILFNPAIVFLVKKKIPRVLATIFVYLVFFGMIGGLIYLVAAPLSSEVGKFTQLFPQYFDRIAPPLSGLGIEAFKNIDSFTATVESWLTNASGSIFSGIFSFFGGVLSTITIFTIAIFLSVEEMGIEKMLILISPKKYESAIMGLWEKSQMKISRWFSSRMISSAFVGFLTFFAAYVLDVEYSVSFGLLSGVTNIIPIIGPVVAGAIIVGFLMIQGLWVKALLMLIIFVLIQQIEGNILTPVLTKRFIGLPAAIVLVSMMIGGKLWGILGAILAIPLIGIFYEFLGDFLKRKKEAAETAV
jgi:predicted PurR-regulated permease PerM